MRYFWTFFWTLALMMMLTYVVSSMVAVSFNIVTALTLGVAATILIFILTSILPKPSSDRNAH